MSCFAESKQASLNAICPYFTMFPLRFPLSVISRELNRRYAVLDPFCGRGTTNFAARLLGIPTLGIDASPVAVAATSAKLVGAVFPQKIVLEAKKILASRIDYDVPTGQFWLRAYKPAVLRAICKLRIALLQNCRSDVRKALRGVLLGALHGPLHTDGSSSYFSNQAPRTYAPKPRYAIFFWRKNGFRPPEVDVLDIIQMRAIRFYTEQLPSVEHRVACGDSRNLSCLKKLCERKQVDLIITSPPYYGLRTYVSDQWVRNWLLGGTEEVDYTYGVQLSHRSVFSFVDDLRKVWINVAAVSHKEARLVFRFGAINDRSVDPSEIIRASLSGTPWQLVTIINAGTSQHGKRQANSFGQLCNKPLVEYDAWARRRN